MKISLFGGTGALGSECLRQAVAAGHDVTVLVRSANKLPADLCRRIRVVEGDALNAEDVWRVIDKDTEAILFAIGVDKRSPPDLCTDVTRIILEALRGDCAARFIWCGGGSTFVEQDVIGLGARFVRKFAETFMSLRHVDKEHQYLLLKSYPDISHLGVRPLQMVKGPMRAQYRLGFDRFNGFSRISFADCAHAMLAMLEDDIWLHQAPIVQY
ncbi:NAD(P)-dependent oxidoreductase [Zhongshania sp.]|uniref:NAD(P)-dependent oxidoreductase n=1 Tax=Zhongshania sp. TaxID=1971902 RepID=UPI0035681B9C